MKNFHKIILIIWKIITMIILLKSSKDKDVNIDINVSAETNLIETRDVYKVENTININNIINVTLKKMKMRV